MKYISKSCLLAVLLAFLFVGAGKSFAQSKTIQTTGDVLLFTLPTTTLTGSLIAKD